jgi:hypothetical protein
MHHFAKKEQSLARNISWMQLSRNRYCMPKTLIEEKGRRKSDEL